MASCVITGSASLDVRKKQNSLYLLAGEHKYKDKYFPAADFVKMILSRTLEFAQFKFSLV